MEAEKALEQIYMALRSIQANAEAHDKMKQLVEIIFKELKKGKEDGVK